ncbi:MAG: transcription antitermination factor NusB [Ahrensia sp.]
MTDQSTPKPKGANKRGAARLAAVQALYQMDIAGTGVLETAAEYETFRLGKELDGEQYRDADAPWFRSIIAGVVNDQQALDVMIRDSLIDGWPLSRLDNTLLAILRAGVWELRNKADVPSPVIVNEYVDIARAFYEDGEEPRMANAVLDRLAKRARSAA